jgi:CheY-like chemotaxis protein
MDIMMPELNGLEATKQIRDLDRKDSKSIVIIALSANVFEKDKQKSIEKGFNSHLKKPIETDVLLETLNKYL